jgi:Ca2+/Na+ antiporter
MKNNKRNILYGVLAAAGAIVYLLAIYGASPSAMLGPLAQWSSLLVYIGFMLAAARFAQPADLKGRLRTAFVVFIIANSIYYVYYYFMYNYVDVGLPELHRSRDLQALEQMNAKGLLTDAYQQNLERIKEADYRVTPGNAIFGLVRSLIGGFLLSLGVAYYSEKAY